MTNVCAFGLSQPSPTRNSRGSEDQPARSQRKIHVAQIWQFYSDARDLNMSMTRLAKVRAREEHGGNTPGSASSWQRKLLQMYDTRLELCFIGAQHLTLITDGSTHGCRDTLVTCVFDPMEQVAGWATCMAIWPSKFVSPGDYDLEMEVERLLARREGERLSSYKLIQALSKQLWLVTRKQLSMSDLKVPVDQLPAIERLEPGDVRTVENGWLHVTKEDGNVFDVDLLGMVQRSTTLGIIGDQGPNMQASMSFLYGHHFLVHGIYDPYHRLVNDCKLSADAAGMLDATCASRFLWGINYGPFGSGQFWEEKKAALAHFMSTTSAELFANQSHVFIYVWLKARRSKQVCLFMF